VAATEELVTTSQAARLLGVSSELVRLMLRDGRIDAQRTPLGSLIPRAEVERLAAERAARSAAK
jgi:excisionase family DNA binding protein